MGMYPYAYLLFGYSVGAEEAVWDWDLDWEQREEMEDELDWYHGEIGTYLQLRFPDDYPQDYEGKPWSWEIEKELPIEISNAGNYDYSQNIVVVKGYSFTNSWDSLLEIDTTKMRPSQDEIDAAEQFCKKYQIKWGEPKWFLAASYG